FGGIPEVVVPDNLRSAVSKAHRYEPDLNPTYQDYVTFPLMCCSSCNRLFHRKYFSWGTT
ncbi:MAG: hypothetical protein ABFS45_25035, partial [Pseudomonadota bacterium]